MNRILRIFLIVIGIMLVSGCVTVDFETSSSNTTSKKKFTYEVTKQYKTSYNISYYIEGKVTNESDKDYSYVQIEFICYDKEGNNLGTAMDNTNNLLGNQTWKFKAMAMISDVKSIDHCDYHEITGW